MSPMSLNNHTNPCLKHILNQMYKDRNKTGDVQFIVESEEILAHRNILAVFSPKYKAQFYGSQSDSGDIKVEGVSAAAFKEFLQFIYIEDVTFTIENIEDVLNLAEQSQVEDLVKKCQKFLTDTVKFDSICNYLRLARLYNLEGLQNACDDMIIMNAETLFKSSDFLECDRDTLNYILKLDALNYKETEIFDACMEWARAECKRQNIVHGNATNLRTALGDAFHNIRFGLMTIEEFAMIYTKHPDLFTKTELGEMLQKFGKVQETESNLFNNMPRIPRHHKLNIVEEKSLDDFCPCFDVIFFQCNKVIDLCGFVMSSGPCSNFEIDVYDGNAFFRDYPKTIEISNEYFQILFEKSVRIVPDVEWPSITVKCPPNVMRKGFFKLESAENNSIAFKFKVERHGICNTCTSIVQLIFNIINTT